MPGRGHGKFQKIVALLKECRIRLAVRIVGGLHQDRYGALFHLVGNAGHHFSQSGRDFPVDGFQRIPRLIGTHIASGGIFRQAAALEVGTVEQVLQVEDGICEVCDRRADHGPEGVGDVQNYCEQSKRIREIDIADADVVGARVFAADAGSQLLDPVGVEGELLTVRYFIEGAPVGVKADSHVVDREWGGVLYFGAVGVVLAADEPVDFDLLKDAEKVIIGSDVSCRERDEEQHGVEPRVGGGATVKAREGDARCRYGAVKEQVSGVEADFHGTFTCERMVRTISSLVMRLRRAPAVRMSRWGSVRAAASAMSSGMQYVRLSMKARAWAYLSSARSARGEAPQEISGLVRVDSTILTQ